MSDASIKHGGRRKTVVLATALVVILALIGWGLTALLGGKSKLSPKPPKITLMTPAAPPPPPPPPKEEKKPDPPKELKEVKVEQPKPKEAPPQPTPELKMDGPAGDGPSAFAAGKITSDDLSKIGTGSGSGGGGGMFNPFNNYANLLKGEVQRYLGKNKALRRRHYTVEVHVWVNGGGELKRFELIGSTGDGDTDEAIRQSMASLSGFSQKMPANMPQPIRLRIVTAG